MKADLANREPRMLAAWERDGLYQKIRLAAKGRLHEPEHLVDAGLDEIRHERGVLLRGQRIRHLARNDLRDACVRLHPEGERCHRAEQGRQRNVVLDTGSAVRADQRRA